MQNKNQSVFEGTFGKEMELSIHITLLKVASFTE